MPNSFAQGYAIGAQIKQAREQAEIQKKLADSRIKLLDSQIEAAQFAREQGMQQLQRRQQAAAATALLEENDMLANPAWADHGGISVPPSEPSRMPSLLNQPLTGGPNTVTPGGTSYSPADRAILGGSTPGGGFQLDAQSRAQLRRIIQQQRAGEPNFQDQSVTLEPGERRVDPFGQEIARGGRRTETLDPGQTLVDPETGRQVGGAGGGGAAPGSTPLGDAVIAQPQLFNSLGAKEKAGILPELVRRGFTFEAANPGEVQKRALERRRLDYEVQKAVREAGGELTPTQRVEQITKLRSSIRAEPDFKNFVEVRNGYQNVTTGAARNDAVGDLAIVNGYAKILDPPGVVRPEEFRTVEEAQPFFARVLNIPYKIFQGDRLLPQYRQQFAEGATQLAQRKASELDRTLTQIYAPLARSLKISPEEIFTGAQLGETPGGGSDAQKLEQLKQRYNTAPAGR